MLLVGLQEGHLACKKAEWWGGSVVICLGQGVDLHMAQLMPLPFTLPCSNKSKFVLPSWFYFFWYWMTRLVPDKSRGP